MLYSQTETEERARIVNIEIIGIINIYKTWGENGRLPFDVQISAQSNGTVTENFCTINEARHFVAKFLRAHSLCKELEVGSLIWDREMVQKNCAVEVCRSCGANRIERGDKVSKCDWWDLD